MSPPPEWLVYATPTIALLAMLIALASFAVAFATYCRTGPRVQVEFEVGTFSIERAKGEAKEVPAIVIHVTNRGMASIGVNHLMLRPRGLIRFLRAGPYLLFEDFDVERLDGEDLPVTIPSNTAMDWAYRIKSAGLEGSRVAGLSEIYDRVRKSKLEVMLGNGRTIRQTVLTFGGMACLGTTRKAAKKS